MLAAEPFSDHPRSVCPVIAASLRAYNDRLQDRWHQDLYAYAANAVGTRSTIAVERRRTEMCRRRTGRTDARAALPEEFGPPRRSGRVRSWLEGYRRERVALAFGRDESDYGGRKLDYELHRSALRFVDELLAAQRQDEPDLPVERPAVLDVENPGVRCERTAPPDRQGGRRDREHVSDRHQRARRTAQAGRA